jgi:hypothetical protein
VLGVPGLWRCFHRSSVRARGSSIKHHHLAAVTLYCNRLARFFNHPSFLVTTESDSNMKRQADSANSNGSAAPSKRRALDDSEARASFRRGLFETEVEEQGRKSYSTSEP